MAVVAGGRGQWQWWQGVGGSVNGGRLWAVAAERSRLKVYTLTDLLTETVYRDLATPAAHDSPTNPH